MAQSITHSDRFIFQNQDLLDKLGEFIQPGQTGYWKFEFEQLSNREEAFYWQLAVVDGKILYSGGRRWSGKTLLSTLHRFTPQLRQEPAKGQLDLLKQEIHNLNLHPIQVWKKMISKGISTNTQLSEALRLKILTDLDIYLLLGSGQSKFVVYRELAGQFPVPGLDLSNILDAAQQRQLRWRKLTEKLPTMDMLPVLDRAALDRSNLSPGQKQRVEDLVKSKKSIAHLAFGMSKDNLEVAQMFNTLADAGLVTFRSPESLVPPTIMIIDDSSVVLSQFQHWLTVLGYPVAVCQNAEIALQQILKVKPATIFIDINMPGISGFELVKQIRQEPELAHIPLAILTGEQKLSNKWRAQWSGCEFLTKPLSMSETSTFQSELPQVLNKLLAESSSPIAGGS
jgi:CheY-like chemotaxis protein